MFSVPQRYPTVRSRAARPAVSLACAGAALLLVAGAIAPIPALAAQGAVAAVPPNQQSVDVAEALAPSVTNASDYSSEKSSASQKAELAAAHDNYAWARLVLWYGGWPITDASVTTILRWMRQENGVDDWWNRNNPLNNGWGVGSYMNSNDSLDAAAFNAADAIGHLYPSIQAVLASGTTNPDDIANGIMFSGWSSSNYGDGSHWSTAPVPSVVAPAEDWGI